MNGELDKQYSNLYINDSKLIRMEEIRQEPGGADLLAFDSPARRELTSEVLRQDHALVLIFQVLNLMHFLLIVTKLIQTFDQVRD